MIVRELGEGGRWYVLAVHYPTALMAKTAWERLERKLGSDLRDIGIYRMASQAESEKVTGPLTSPSGAPDRNVYPVAGVTLSEPVARRALRLLRDGTEWDLDPDFADALIVRRARVLSQVPEGFVGQTRIRRPEGKGAQLDQRGVMHEQEPGRG